MSSLTRTGIGATFSRPSTKSESHWEDSLVSLGVVCCLQSSLVTEERDSAVEWDLSMVDSYLLRKDGGAVVILSLRRKTGLRD